MALFLQLLVSGLALGTIYALVALGFVVIYRSSQVFNFAHGEFLTFGAFVMITLLDYGMPWGVALLGAMVATAALGNWVGRRVLVRMPERIFRIVLKTLLTALALRLLWIAARDGGLM